VATTAPQTTNGNESTTTSTISQQETSTTTPVQNAAGGILMKASGDSFCIGSTEYPCYMPISDNPYKILGVANENETMPPSANSFSIVWPEATVGGNRGDAVSVECYITDGQSSVPIAGGQSSTDWYEIAVPVSKITNHYVISELEHPGSTQLSPITSFDFNGVQSVQGWAPIGMFDEANLTPAPNVPACKST
jgi:hypothetical protein